MKFTRSRKLVMGAGLAGLLAAGLGPVAMQQHWIGEAKAQSADDVMVPWFEADPHWPKPLPSPWILAMTIGLATDANDNVWVLHRPQTLEANETYATRKAAQCCTAAPDVMAFDPAGNLIRSWGREQHRGQSYDWPSSNHGISIDPAGNVWLGGNGSYQPLPPPGTAEQLAAPMAPPTAPPPFAGGPLPRYHDSFVLKFSPDGKYIGQIGKANGSKGSLDNENVRGVAQIKFIPQANEVVLADGYGNKRVSVWDATTFKFKRAWGAYGKTPSDDPIPHFNVDSPQFGNPVHCALPSNDGLIYVCDRTNNRIQVFRTDGTYVRQHSIRPDTKGVGAPWDITLSPDPKQQFMYVSDGTNAVVRVYDRQTMRELYWFGGGGRQPGQFYGVHNIITNSKGDIFTAETYRGQRVQKFTYKGLIRLSELVKMGVVGSSRINP